LQAAKKALSVERLVLIMHLARVMSATKTQIAEEKTHTPETAKKDLRNLEKVRAIFAALSKYIHAKTIYTSNNPNVGKFAGAYYETFRILFEHEKELVLTIEQYQITWNDEVVYDNNEKNGSIAFLLFKDGVGEITFGSTVKQAELDQFADLIKNEIYNPLAHLDVVSRLWQLEFKDIQYRVFDECTDGSSGDGGKSGSDSQEQPLQANDHRSVESAADNDKGKFARPNNAFCSLGTYLSRVVEHNRPGASAWEHEKSLQDAMESIFKVSAEELESWREECFATSDQDRLLWFLDVMVDFTQIRSTPAVTRDIMDTIDHVVRYIIWEARIPALMVLLNIQKKIAQSSATAPDFAILSDRIYRELTDNAFLLLLGRNASESRDKALETRRYFESLGKVAVPGFCELLSNSKDPVIHKNACDGLIAIVGNDVMSIIDELNLDNPYEAKDAVYLLHNAFPGEIPPLIKELISSTDPQVRGQVTDHLVNVGNDEAALLLCQLLDDDDASVRIKTFAAIESVEHPAIIDKVTALCFESDTATKSADELERMFRAVGIIAGEKVLEQVKQLMKKKSWLPFGKSRDKGDKLLAITALRHIPGGKSLELLKALARDRDSLVRTKASYVIKRFKKTDEDREEEPMLVESKEAE
jgi:hypothetical protein